MRGGRHNLFYDSNCKLVSEETAVDGIEYYILLQYIIQVHTHTHTHTHKGLKLLQSKLSSL